jgi:hypothetical protein
MILFLDFDGVLHPMPTDTRGHFCHLLTLEQFLGKYADVQVVISSSWRETYPFNDVIVALFSPDVRSRILGMTPIVKLGSRHHEIQAWIEANGYTGRWLALDDARDEFPAQCRQLIACDTKTGLDKAVLTQLTMAVESADSE